MQAWESPIIRVSTGLLNTVNDTVIGNQAGITGASKFAGQLGKQLFVSQEQIGQMFSSAIGTVYGGGFRYVRARAADTPAYTVGEILFWDTTVTSWQSAYQVTREEDLSSVANAIMIAGIYLGGFTAGNYGFIQEVGIVPVKFRGTLTAAGAIGSAVYAAAAGDGVDEGYADVLASGNPTTFSDLGLLQSRFLGNAVAAPDNGSLTNVVLRFQQLIG